MELENCACTSQSITLTKGSMESLIGPDDKPHDTNNTQEVVKRNNFYGQKLL